MSFRPEVIVGSSQTWSTNALRFATREEAERSAHDLMCRWIMVRDRRAAECDDPVRHRLTPDGVLEFLDPPTPPAD